MSDDDPVLASLWERVTADWDDPACHRALLGTVTEPAQLAAVSKLYRQQLADPRRHEVAEHQLRAITAIAMARLESPKRPERGRGPLWAALMVLILATFAATYALVAV